MSRSIDHDDILTSDRTLGAFEALVALAAALYTSRMSPLRILALSTVLALGGCGGSGVRVEPVSVKTAPPGRVLALVSVSDRGGAPEDLGPQNFEVREGEVALDGRQIGLQVQSLGALRGHEAVVLVDGSHAFTDAERAPLGRALSELVDRLRFHQAVTLLAYDGASDLRFVARYTQSEVAAPLGKDPGIARLLAEKPRDGSSSLYTAIVNGRRALDARLLKTGLVARVGSLIVVARGPDLAGRVDEAQAREALVGQRSFLLKVGTWSTDSSLDWVGSSGVRAAASLGTLGSPVDDLARAVDEVFLRGYVVSYCSPARAGKRSLELVVKLADESGRERSARAASEFDATGFNGSCQGGISGTSL